MWNVPLPASWMYRFASFFVIHDNKWSLWVLDFWLKKRSNLKMWLRALVNCDDHFSKFFEETTKQFYWLFVKIIIRLFDKENNCYLQPFLRLSCDPSLQIMTWAIQPQIDFSLLDCLIWRTSRCPYFWSILKKKKVKKRENSGKQTHFWIIYCFMWPLRFLFLGHFSKSSTMRK